MRDEDLKQLQERLSEIKQMGWIENRRPGNVGGIGNTLEDLLDVAENNYQLPDFGEWEIKSQRRETTSLLTLFHKEPYPRKVSIVNRILIPKYGWPHQEAGTKYPADEMSFRQTINTQSYSDKGFKVVLDRGSEQIYVTFDYSKIDDRHDAWRTFVRDGVGTGELSTKPSWSFKVISTTLKKKIQNLMYVRAEQKKEDGIEFFKYEEFDAYLDPSLEKFLNLIEKGSIYVDFDARTHHNHGTKFRIKPSEKEQLYTQHIKI